MSYRMQSAFLICLILLLTLVGCRGTVKVVYSCEGTVSEATVWYTSSEGTSTQTITLPWEQTVYLPEKSGVPELKVEIPDEQHEISCGIIAEGDTGSDSAAGPEIIVRGADSGN